VNVIKKEQWRQIHSFTHDGIMYIPIEETYASNRGKKKKKSTK
jgi:hypothetical protein